MSLSRRSFVKSAVAAGGLLASGALLGACAEDDATANADSVLWDKEADVVVVGYGGAGAAAAITAHDAGSEVLVLEKMSVGGGNTGNSGGGFLSPNDAEGAYTYIKSLYDFSFSVYNDDLVRTFSDESIKNLEWVIGLGKNVETMVYGHAGFADLEGADTMDKYCITPEEGGGGSEELWSGARAARLFKILNSAVVDDRGIEVMLETPASRLITNGDNEIIGVVAEQGGNELTIKARKAVILTTGGFEYDTEMLQNNIKGYPVYALGSPGNTGDGIRMAQAVGADIWHMNGTSCSLGFKTDEYEAAFSFQTFQPSMIWVNKHGKRFVNEKGVETHAGLLAVDHYEVEDLGYPNIPSYRVFDETALQCGKVCASKNLNNYVWSDDNQVEIDKGWIVKADTIDELASKIGMDPATLNATIETWNRSVEAGEDVEFGRPIGIVDEKAYLDRSSSEAASAKIMTAPFYAIVQYPTLINTQGGPLRNAEAQILNVFGEPIPRLYAAGELGSMWGIIYQGSGNVGECFVYGRIAGANAAALEPWEATAAS